MARSAKHKSAHLEALAKEALSAARQVKSLRAKAVLVDVAQCYVRLADLKRDWHVPANDDEDIG